MKENKYDLESIRNAIKLLTETADSLSVICSSWDDQKGFEVGEINDNIDYSVNSCRKTILDYCKEMEASINRHVLRTEENK